MQLQYLVIPARDLNVASMQQILVEGWTVNDPSLIVLSRPTITPAPEPAVETTHNTEILDASGTPV